MSWYAPKSPTQPPFINEVFEGVTLIGGALVLWLGMACYLNPISKPQPIPSYHRLVGFHCDPTQKYWWYRMPWDLRINRFVSCFATSMVTMLPSKIPMTAPRHSVQWANDVCYAQCHG